MIHLSNYLPRLLDYSHAIARALHQEIAVLVYAGKKIKLPPPKKRMMDLLL